jgi:uncharacterized protein (TIGR03118 family)
LAQPHDPILDFEPGENTATLYDVTDETNVTRVNINPPSGFVAIPTTAPPAPQGTTGQVNNTNTECFPVSMNGGDGGSAHFIFANLSGTISAWDKGPTAFVQAMGTTGTVYTGLAINGAQTRLYAANTLLGRIDVYGCSFNPVSLDSGTFVDLSLATGLVPFNVQDIGGDVYVVYAPARRPAEISAPLGAGAVAIFDEDGNFIKELVADSRLAAPWGITIVPPGFRRFSNDVLVGNFSFKHSEINAFIPSNGKLYGTIPAASLRAVSGQSSSVSAATTAVPMSFTSPTGLRARRTQLPELCARPISERRRHYCERLRVLGFGIFAPRYARHRKQKVLRLQGVRKLRSKRRHRLHPRFLKRLRVYPLWRRNLF